MILTDKDAKTLENNTKFKSVELNENFVNVDMNKATSPSPVNQALEKTLVDDKSMSDASDNKTPHEGQISLYDAKRLNESHKAQVKDQRL